MSCKDRGVADSRLLPKPPLGRPQKGEKWAPRSLGVLVPKGEKWAPRSLGVLVPKGRRRAPLKNLGEADNKGSAQAARLRHGRVRAISAGEDEKL